jgi:hypothetical protein
MKFPLVPQLTEAIVAGRHVIPALKDVGTSVNRYMHDETLLLFRSSRKHAADALLPSGKAQALHVSNCRLVTVSAAMPPALYMLYICESTAALAHMR